MPRRTRRLLITLPAGLVAVLLVLWLLWPRTAITRENAERIQGGMTLAEVEAILGGPARNESTGPLRADVHGNDSDDDFEILLWRAVADRRRSDPRLASARHREWMSNSVIVRIILDGDHRVVLHDSLPVRRDDESPLDRLRRWLGL